ncbi:MAG: glycosyltransferase family 1 protein, partial [Desulfovibrionaceae bacterium]|nr:glycosyltransferase family 1 protein [Desulfovibrionaceae bacterium]
IPAAEQIAAVCPEPDLVLMELYGSSLPVPPDLHACPYRLAAWCIDSSINEFWLSELLPLMDDVFVDQLSSVKTLARRGINAVWLPLCISESCFRGPQAKEYEISFVGRTSSLRKKRNNLIRLLSLHYRLHQAQGISRDEMQNIFARSKIVLNENLFSGLTLRVLQGMAAGALVLTEAGGEGVDRFFVDGKHLLTYTPDNIVSRIACILDDFPSHEAIARAGQEACRAGHTSRVRAGEFLGHIRNGTASNPRADIHTRQCAEAYAHYIFCQRFGGAFRKSVAGLNKLAETPDKVGARAAFILGDIHAREGRKKAASQFYTQAAEKGYIFFPQSKLALLLLQEGKIKEAGDALAEGLVGLASVQGEMPGMGAAALSVFRERIGALPETEAQAALLFFMARIYAALGYIFSPGFLKQTPDTFPNTALELAGMAWEKAPGSAVLDFMLECAAACGIEAELLPQCCRAIELGLADDRQILRTAELARQYYDKDLAMQILSAMRKTRPR